MTRVVSVDATQETVTAMCAKLGVTISVMEPLLSGGMRVILNNSGDADAVRSAMKARLITGPSVRSSLYVSRIGKRGR